MSSQVSPGVSFITPKPSIQFMSNKSYTFRKSHFKPYPDCTYFPLRYCRHFHISAQLGGRSSRRNSLRRKLTDNLQVRPKIPPNPTFETNNTDIQSNLNASEQKTGFESIKISEIVSEVDGVERNKGIGESVLWNKLEGWIDHYKKDVEFWGLGSSPIFTVHQDLKGNVKRVFVDEDEIWRRSGIPHVESRDERESEEFAEVKSKISHARFVAQEMERGNYLLSKSSSVAKFVAYGDSSSGFVSGIRSGVMRSDFIPKVSRFGIVPLCCLLLVWTVKKFIFKGDGENELSRLEKEMLRRKMESRKKKEERSKDAIVQVVPELIMPATEFVERPCVDKEDLMNSIKEMARHSREVEKAEHSSYEQPFIEIDTVADHLDDPDNHKSEHTANAEDTDSIAEKEPEKSMGNTVLEEIEDQLLSTPKTSITGHSKVERNSQLERKDSHSSLQVSGTNDLSSSIGQSTISKEACRKKPRIIRSVAEAREYLSGKQDSRVSNSYLHENHMQESNSAFAEVGEDTRITSDHMSEEFQVSSPPNIIPSANSSSNCRGNSSYSYPMINGKNGRALDTFVPSASAHDLAKDEGSNVDTKNKLGKEEKISGTLRPEGPIQASQSIVSKGACQNSVSKEDVRMRTEINEVNIDLHSSVVQSTSAHNSASQEDADFNSSQRSSHGKKMSDIVKPTGLDESVAVSATNASDDSVELNNDDVSKNHAVDKVLTAANSEECEEYGQKLKIESIVKNNWLEKNFDELLPVLEKMGDGFTKNYAVAREKVKQELDRCSDLTQLGSALNDNTELEWMDDDELREIVFKVRDNELAGRDPFHSMDDEDKVTFYKGLEEKVDKESEKLSALHEFLHSNIENLDYGADGISVYDPPEKIIPRWKGAPFDKIRDLLANTPKTQQAATDSTAQEKLDKKLAPSKNVKPRIKVTEKPKIVIESSDGSVKPGKRTGKEQWQHTKKHSLGFLESYNAETDPEIKAIMKDMGKDLDRWITEEEVKKAAKLMSKIPQRSKAFVEKKLSKIKHEVERFGTQAVLSKYKEYSVEEEEDYLWWLDLPFVLCIELYTNEGDELKVGFYTLEMAEDLELDPKPYHVIAFEELAECKNLCYIIQSHLEMLGKDDKAFVVAQPPKDAFRDAKANGFAVTVIRKGELPLNVDQPLEEVEELITEIGSKIYHDKIMKERSVDMRSIMKGVLSTSKPTKRKKVKRRPLRKPKN